VRDEWGNAIYPMVPGHEIVGRVTATGSAVTKFKPGDLAGVGVLVDSCRVCANCKASLENYCQKGFVGTYNALDYDGALVFGGYSNNIVCHERYVHSISPKLSASSPPSRLCSAPASPPTRRCATGRSAPAARSAS